MTDQEIRKLERIAENSKNGKASSEAMAKLQQINSTYHWCIEWDGMVICDKHPEFDVCLCFKNQNK